VRHQSVAVFGGRKSGRGDLYGRTSKARQRNAEEQLLISRHSMALHIAGGEVRCEDVTGLGERPVGKWSIDDLASSADVPP